MQTITDRKDISKPQWAIRFLEARGFAPDTSMDTFQQLWWGWYTQSNEYYSQPYTLGDGASPCQRLSIKPASMVANEFPSLVMTEGTEISSPDEDLNSWIERTMPNFADQQADFLANVFALGTGAWAADFTSEGTTLTCVIRSYNAWQVIPLKGSGCAFLSRVTISSKDFEQLQVRYISPETGTELIETFLFTEGGLGKPVEVEGITPLLDTRSPHPTWVIVTPSKYNQHVQYTSLGASILEDATDAFRLVDEAFNQLYWQVRLSLPRVIADESGLKRNPKTGAVETGSTINQVLYMKVESATGDMPVTIYNPQTHISDMVMAMNHALGMLGQRTGFGVGYWSFDLNQGLQTATEVVASNSVLMRTIRRHEHTVENAIRALIKGAYSASCALQGRTLQEMPEVSVLWDDSVVSDDKQDRDMMKDDITRGLCPKWRYLVTYYGMSEEEAREFTGEVGAEALDVALGEY